MRIWTVHPEYLDRQGLLAVWREALLAQKVLRGRTRGYRHHPQLARFRAQPDPVAAIAAYLRAIHREATRRGYHFKAMKIAPGRTRKTIAETSGQLACEWQHLLRKLKTRSPAAFSMCRTVKNPSPHPLFRMVQGPARDWEKIILH